MSKITLYYCTCPECGKGAPGIRTGDVLLVPRHKLSSSGATCPGSGSAPVDIKPEAGSSIEVDSETGLPVDGRYLKPGYDSVSHWWDGYLPHVLYG